MPEVAVALINRTDFVSCSGFSSMGLTNFHMASIYGYTSVCKALLARIGPAGANLPTLTAVELLNKDGQNIHVPAFTFPKESARQASEISGPPH